MMAQARASICACPTTERNLGDGILRIDHYFKEGVPVSLGTDSQIQIDLLEDARELEYHLRLQRTQRNVLAKPDDQNPSALAARLFDCATVNGAESIGSAGGKLEPGLQADFFTIDLNDSSIAGASADNLLANTLFSSSRTAVRDVVVAGKRIIENGEHANQGEIVESFKTLQKKLWS
jgi:formimidoylglutamate deiminase